jgi:hypothetical protein
LVFVAKLKLGRVAKQRVSFEAFAKEDIPLTGFAEETRGERTFEALGFEVAYWEFFATPRFCAVFHRHGAFGCLSLGPFPG